MPLPELKADPFFVSFGRLCLHYKISLQSKGNFRHLYNKFVRGMAIYSSGFHIFVPFIVSHTLGLAGRQCKFKNSLGGKTKPLINYGPQKFFLNS